MNKLPKFETAHNPILQMAAPELPVPDTNSAEDKSKIDIESDNPKLDGHNGELENGNQNGAGDKPDAHQAHGDNEIHYDPNIPMKNYEVVLEKLFKIRERKSSIKLELQTGFVQFISCLYILPVVPQQMARASYERTPTIVATSAACAIGCIMASFLTNLPMIVAPPTSVSIFLAVYLQQHNMGMLDGNAAVVVSGACLLLIGIRPLGRFVAQLIPGCIQASTSVGIGLITALAGATEIHLVVHGKFTILDMGEITDEVIIAMFCLAIIGGLLHYHVKGAFCIALLVGTFVSWIVTSEWPEGLAEDPYVVDGSLGKKEMTSNSCLLFFNLVFLYTLTLNGLARSFSDLAQLTEPDGNIPNGRWLFFCCGLTTMFSGFMSGPPILISPESAAGIKAGAKTGLSTLVCGICFALACFFSPLFAAVPGAGTSPLLLAVGVVLFANVRRIDWSNISEALPAYCIIFFIPFTYSILRGIAFGYVFYVLMGIMTGSLYGQLKDIVAYYREKTPTDFSKILEGLTFAKALHILLTSMDIGAEDTEATFEDLLAKAAKDKPKEEDDWVDPDSDTLGDLPALVGANVGNLPPGTGSHSSHGPPGTPISPMARRDSVGSGRRDSFSGRERGPSFHGDMLRRQSTRLSGSNAVELGAVQPSRLGNKNIMDQGIAFI